ncbi:hypothetical protein [Fulvivirga sedimenti]|uniref:Uncharacterized protein n=1 Tax=Fulvivirga sedimenti TaxID=2879465 RepID=A0A9X1HKK7_9BACT|nr:hypothetical protein [Fulvivirga sedimenti]MCA6073695.1 hypothetical protein [Fulvivirga sedimenti]
MDYNRIEELLTRYWECETTLEEERELKAFFQSGNVPEKWRKEAVLFTYFREEREEGRLGEFFDHRILEQVHEIEGQTEVQKSGRVRRMWQDISKVAAVILVLVTAVYFARDEYLSNREEINQPIAESESVQEAREAYEQTKAALLMLSKSMNKGTEQVGKMAVFNEAQEMVRNEDADQKNIKK